MASVNFYLKNKQAINKTRIYVVLTDIGGIKIQLPTSHSINPKHWSGKGKFVLSANSDSTNINKNINAFKKNVLNIYEEAKAKGLKASSKYIIDKLKPKEDAITESKLFWNVWSYYLIAKRNNYKPRSFVKFKSLENHLIKFEAFDKIPLELDTTTKKTLERLQDYFYNEANLNTQTTSKYIDLFKVFLNWSFDEQYTQNNSYRSFKTIKQPDSLKVILTHSDIQKIKEKKLNKQSLINVRELLILSTLTGLRYSDYSRISKEHIKTNDEGRKTLQIRMEKTSSLVEIPLIPESERILNKILKGEIHPITNQKMNLYVKELCKEAEINEPFEVHQYKGKITISKKVEKYELITTHTGRRTFATRLLIKGVSPHVVMNFTGHKDFRSFEKYVNIPKNVEMEIVSNALLGQ